MYASLYSHLIISLWKSIHLPSVVAFHGQSPKVKKLKWVGFDSTNLSIWSKQPSILTLSRDTMELLMVKMIICVLIFLASKLVCFLFQIVLLPLFFLKKLRVNIPSKKHIYAIYMLRCWFFHLTDASSWNYQYQYMSHPTWRIIPFSKWLVTPYL